MRPIEFSRRRGFLALTAIGGIGLYDGFFGPGTGSFLMLLFIRLYGFDFLHASASARAINVATNAGALMFFGIHGEIHWALGIALGACNATGSVLGANTAIKHGSKFVRVIVHRHRRRADRQDRRRRVASAPSPGKLSRGLASRANSPTAPHHGRKRRTKKHRTAPSTR